MHQNHTTHYSPLFILSSGMYIQYMYKQNTTPHMLATNFALLKTVPDTNIISGDAPQNTTQRAPHDPKQNILCKKCKHQITNSSFAISKNGSHEHAFFNPHGYIFQLKCFSKAPGCLPSGNNYSDFSWFSGYRWQIAICGKCLCHLGWAFVSEYDSFYGIIKDNIQNSSQ
ncbi:cereblon family protein [Maridesulfovibrio frigidus]|uniref:cereblon family protein n=1 Tax=Maridesulfovibrio frigidus TaxID=340956 RepID=UPI001F3D79BA|nr:cereblon family protein [Maridesulfovibrio frigidus]